MSSTDWDKNGLPDTYGSQIVPCYLVIEQSHTMSSLALSQLNIVLTNIHKSVCSDPSAHFHLPFTIIAFADSAKVLVSLSRLGDLQQMPGLVGGKSCRYIPALELLYERIQKDVGTLQKSGFRVRRPLVFFVVSGHRPIDTWQDTHRSLIGVTNHLRPNIIVFGVEALDYEHLASLAFIVKAGADDMPGSAYVVPEAETKTIGDAILRTLRSVLHYLWHGGGFTLSGVDELFPQGR